MQKGYILPSCLRKIYSCVKHLSCTQRCIWLPAWSWDPCWKASNTSDSLFPFFTPPSSCVPRKKAQFWPTTSKYSTNSKFYKCYIGQESRTHSPSKKSQSKLYFPYRLSLAKTIGRDWLQPVTLTTIDNQSRMHKSKIITYKLDTRKDNHLWDLSLGKKIFFLGKYEQKVHDRKRLSS